MACTTEAIRMNEELDEWEQYEEDGLLDLEVGQSVGPCISSPHESA
jgi:hypothetical protein